MPNNCASGSGWWLSVSASVTGEPLGTWARTAFRPIGVGRASLYGETDGEGKTGLAEAEVRRLIVGITGSSGAIVGVRLLELLKDCGVETHLVMSKAAELAL